MPTPSRTLSSLTGLTLAALLATGAAAPIERDPKSLVKVELLPASTTAAPGKPITLALKFTIAPNWHIYWTNPGESGMATAPALQLPPGWTASPWRFPNPTEFIQPGDIIGYGYKDQAVLLVDVTPPADFTGQAKIDATAVYLVCETVCLPGQETLSVTLQAGDPKPQEPATALIRDWEKQMPTPFAGTIKATGTLAKTWSPFEVELSETGANWKSAKVFPASTDDVDLREIKAEMAGGAAGKATLRFSARFFGSNSVVPATIPLLVVFTTADGSRQGRWVDVPSGAIAPANGPTPSQETK